MFFTKPGLIFKGTRRHLGCSKPDYKIAIPQGVAKTSQRGQASFELPFDKINTSCDGKCFRGIGNFEFITCYY